MAVPPPLYCNWLLNLTDAHHKLQLDIYIIIYLERMMENKPEIQNEKNKIVALLERIFKQIKNNDIKGVDQSIELANSLISQLPGALKDQSRYKNRLTDLVKQKEATVANEGNTDAWTDVNVWMSYKSPNQTGFDYIVLSEDYDIPIMTSEPDTVPIDPAPMSTD